MSRLRSALLLAAHGAALLALAACGGGGSRPADGIVGRLTGDDDSEVTNDLEELVEKAFSVPADGEPIPD
jgi:ABC-type glycerol-3-phosphate transport system substrate-binding protein